MFQSIQKFHLARRGSLTPPSIDRRRSPKGEGLTEAYNPFMERYRIVKDVGLYYVTFTVVEWLPVFIDEAACKIITDSLNYCIENKYLGVNAYVIMPTHLHAVLNDVQLSDVGWE